MSIGRLMRQRIDGDQLDPGTFALLKGLHCHGAMRVTDLAAFAGLDTSTVSRHVQHLHKAGLIERSSDPADGRAQKVGLTAEGREILEQSIARRHDLLNQTLKHWDESEIDLLDTLLARFVSDIAQTRAALEHNR